MTRNRKRKKKAKMICVGFRNAKEKKNLRQTRELGKGRGKTRKV